MAAIPGAAEALTETLVRSEELCKGGFLHVLRDTVRLPDGKEATREFVRHPGAVVVIPLLDDGGAHRLDVILG